MKTQQAYKVWQPTYIHSTAKIGAGSKICAFCDIGKYVVIGKNCNIQSHVTVSNKCKIGNNVFIGPNTSLLNDKHMDGTIEPVIVEDYVKIGGGVVVLPRVRIGERAIVGAGSVVTQNVQPLTVVFGNPAKVR